MKYLRLWAAWFFFLRVIWPTYDTYSDIGISVYCVYHDMRAWGITMTLPIISNLACSISAYIRMRKRGELLGPGAYWSSEGFALPLLIWPQLQASRIGGMMWRRERGWKGKKRQFERNEGTIESIVEGVAQSFIACFIIIQKYVEKNEEYGYSDPDLGSEIGNSTSGYPYTVQDFSHRESFGIFTLVFMVVSSVGSLASGIWGLYTFLLKGPLKVVLNRGVGNRFLLFVVIIFGMASRFGSLTAVFMFSTSLEPVGLWQQFVAYILLILGFTGVQLTLSLIPLMSFGPRRFFNLLLSFPHILIVPLVTPFTFGLVCDEGCCCHCCCCCGCSKPRLALSRSLSLANHIATLLLMIPPIVFFDFIYSWDLGAVQLCIAVLGLIAAPILLFQPGRINKLGILDPDNVMQQLLAEVEAGGCVFALSNAVDEEPVPEDEEEEDGNEAEMKNLIAVHSSPTPQPKGIQESDKTSI